MSKIEKLCAYMYSLRIRTQLLPHPGTYPTDSHVACFFRLRNFQLPPLVRYGSVPMCFTENHIGDWNFLMGILMIFVRFHSSGFLELLNFGAFLNWHVLILYDTAFSAHNNGNNIVIRNTGCHLCAIARTQPSVHHHRHSPSPYWTYINLWIALNSLYTRSLKP